MMWLKHLYELSNTHGIISQHSPFILASRVRANIKVSSTETSHIFGTIVFDSSSSVQKTYINLNDLQLDLMDYIRPAECKHEEFRAMWAEFEWENKVRVVCPKSYPTAGIVLLKS